MRIMGLLAIAAALLATALSCAPAQAQATRTWVSGVGDDANPCSRTAPCKTFAGAISKTAPAGEIDVLDPGGFGAVTITKAMSIYDDGVGEAGVLVSGTNGIVVQAGVNDVINLRGLVFNGLGASLSGVNFISGAQLNIQNCVIQQFATGITFAPTTSNAKMKVQDTTVLGNAAGVFIKPTGGFSANVVIDRSRIDSNSGGGVRADGTGGGPVSVAISNSSVSLNTSNGVNAVSGASGNVAVTLMHDTVSMNGLAGLQANNGNGGTASLTIGLSLIMNNATATTDAGTAVVNSYVTNEVVGPLGSGFTSTGLQ
jgi:hypothetical protein